MQIERPKSAPKNLTVKGFITTHPFLKPLETPDYNFDLETVEKVRAQIKIHLGYGINLCHKVTSYGLKHLFENVIGQYVSNGEMIYAMLLESYKYKQDSFESINCYFNIAPTSLKKLREFIKK